MGVRFNPYSDEEMCGALVQEHGYDCACMRTRGHEGQHIAVARDAGAADGVRFCCRVPLKAVHEEWCTLTKHTVCD